MLNTMLLIASAAITVAAADDNDASVTNVVRGFHRAVADGNVKKVLSFIADAPGKDQFAEQLPFILEDKESLAGAKPVEARVSGAIAIVIVAREGQEYRLGVDVDPFCLMKVQGHWKLLPSITTFSEEAERNAGSAQPKKGNVEALMKWYKERKEKIYEQRESAKAAAE